MWIFIWLLTGLPTPIPPTVMSYPSQAKCETQLDTLKKQLTVIEGKVKSEMWCVEATATEPQPSYWNGGGGIILTPGTDNHLTTH
jgi:hypothetical protein